jgi:hypothetical protein
VRPARDADPVLPRGEETRDGLVGWMKNELSKGSERAYDLGKFFFTVSIGTAGLLAALAKDARNLPLIVLAISLNALSAVAALAMAWPKTWSLGSETDLLLRYNVAMKKNLGDLRRWAFFYAAAFIVSTVAIVTRT